MFQKKKRKKKSVSNLQKTGLYGYIYDFSVAYDSTDGADKLDIDKCLMVKNNTK